MFVTEEAVVIARSFCSPSGAVCACALLKWYHLRGLSRGELNVGNI